MSAAGTTALRFDVPQQPQLSRLQTPDPSNAQTRRWQLRLFLTTTQIGAPVPTFGPPLPGLLQVPTLTLGSSMAPSTQAAHTRLWHWALFLLVLECLMP